MAGRSTQRTIVLSAILILSISVVDIQQNSTSQGLDSGTDNPDPFGLAIDKTGSQNGSAAALNNGSIRLAGNAPCNPEQEVCNK